MLWKSSVAIVHIFGTKVDTEEIVGILSKSVETAKATLVVLSRYV